MRDRESLTIDIEKTMNTHWIDIKTLNIHWIIKVNQGWLEHHELFKRFEIIMLFRSTWKIVTNRWWQKFCEKVLDISALYWLFCGVVHGSQKENWIFYLHFSALRLFLEPHRPFLVHFYARKFLEMKVVECNSEVEVLQQRWKQDLLNGKVLAQNQRMTQVA